MPLSSRSPRVRRARPLLGTFVEIEIECPEGGEEAAHRAIDGAFAAIACVARRMSAHDPQSTLSHLNRHAFHQAVPVDHWTFEVLETARSLHQISGGLFDPTIAPVLESLGFLPASGDEITPRQGACGFDQVELLEGNRVRFLHPGIRLDLGGIAKGFAVDQAVESLCEAGISSGLVNAGGDLRAFGECAFPVIIRNPTSPGEALTRVRLRQSALATSAHYFAGRIVPSTTLGPVVDPHSGLQGGQEILSATVGAKTAMLADALTKIVMLDAARALPILAHFQAEAFVVSADAQIQYSPSWNDTFPLSP